MCMYEAAVRAYEEAKADEEALAYEQEKEQTLETLRRFHRDFGIPAAPADVRGCVVSLPKGGSLTKMSMTSYWHAFWLCSQCEREYAFPVRTLVQLGEFIIRIRHHECPKYKPESVDPIDEACALLAEFLKERRDREYD